MKKNKSQFVLILSIAIKTPFDLDRIKTAITNFSSVVEWSQDLDEIDKIFRIVSREDISEKLILDLKREEVSVSALGMFGKEGNKSSVYFCDKGVF